MYQEEKMKPKIVQFDIREENRKDYRQARAVLKYRPDIIIFENPEHNLSPESKFNKYSPQNKPMKEFLAIQKYFKIAAKEGFGYALSDIKTWKNIMQLWREGHNVLIYDVDGPAELRQEFFHVWRHMYPCALKNWLWVACRFYIREVIMAKHVCNILKKYKAKTNPTILICLQKIHWVHVKFLLSNPSKEKIWKYYFGRFKEISRKNITSKIKKENKVFYKYWKKYSGF